MKPINFLLPFSTYSINTGNKLLPPPDLFPDAGAGRPTACGHNCTFCTRACTPGCNLASAGPINTAAAAGMPPCRTADLLTQIGTLELLTKLYLAWIHWAVSYPKTKINLGKKESTWFFHWPNRVQLTPSNEF